MNRYEKSEQALRQTHIFGLRKLFLDSVQQGGGEDEGRDEIDVDLPHQAMRDLEVLRRTAVSDSYLETCNISNLVLHQNCTPRAHLRNVRREFDFGQDLGDDPLGPLLHLVDVEEPVVVEQLPPQVRQNGGEPVLLGHDETRRGRPPLDADEALPECELEMGLQDVEVEEQVQVEPVGSE